MNRHETVAAAFLLTAFGAASGALAQESSPDAALTADQIAARHIEARGGAERWREVQSLRAVGAYSAFSFSEPFTLLRQRGDLYRLDFSMLEAPAVRARDLTGPWGLHKLLWPEPTRIAETPYAPQFEREAIFGPLLLDFGARGISLEALGGGEVDGIATVGLRVTLADGAEETWHLDAETFLEVSVVSQVVDFTQASGPVQQTSFFDDFRTVDGLVLPHWIEHQFNHRLESMTVERYQVNPTTEDLLFGPPLAASE